MVPPPSRRPPLALLAIFGLAAMVRCQHLADASYTFDEAFCWKMTTFSAAEVWNNVAGDNHPPLYFYLLWGWALVVGDSPAALRLPSVAFGLAAVAAAYLLVRRIGGSRAAESSGGRELSPAPPRAPDELPALAAAALVALSPMQVDWAQQVRMYALGAALTLLSTWLLLRALWASEPRWSDFAWYVLAATGLAYTHYFALFILAGHLLYAIGRGLAPGGSHARHSLLATVPNTERVMSAPIALASTTLRAIMGDLDGSAPRRPHGVQRR